MRRVLVALTILGATAVPAHADHDRYLTIAGPGAGYADLRLDREVTLDYLTGRVEGVRGKVAGMYVRRLDSAAEGFTLLSVPGRRIQPVAAPRLTPGTYRVYLLSEGPARVRVLAHGLRRNVTLRVATRRTFSVNEGRMDVRTVAPVRYEGARTTPLRGGESLIFTAWSVDLPERVYPVTWGEVEACFEDGAATCDAPTDGWAPGNRTSSHGSGPVHTEPGWLPTALRQRYFGTEKPVEAWALALQIAL